MNLDNPRDMPVGFVMSLSMDMQAMTNFALLSDQDKEQIISYIEASTTGDEAKARIKESISSLHNQSL
ncbi:hypothetical protein lbkm_3175 [Lachnospiraceae bacterium KM106-2]|nr:hypothetical protein lbkm_3175 [Lachnospiraceae bacterium KM106-2]